MIQSDEYQPEEGDVIEVGDSPWRLYRFKGGWSVNTLPEDSGDSDALPACFSADLNEIQALADALGAKDKDGNVKHKRILRKLNEYSDYEEKLCEVVNTNRDLSDAVCEGGQLILPNLARWLESYRAPAQQEPLPTELPESLADLHLIFGEHVGCIVCSEGYRVDWLTNGRRENLGVKGVRTLARCAIRIETLGDDGEVIWRNPKDARIEELEDAIRDIRDLSDEGDREILRLRERIEELEDQLSRTRRVRGDYHHVLNSRISQAADALEKLADQRDEPFTPTLKAAGKVRFKRDVSGFNHEPEKSFNVSKGAVAELIESDNGPVDKDGKAIAVGDILEKEGGSFWRVKAIEGDMATFDWGGEPMACETRHLFNHGPQRTEFRDGDEWLDKKTGRKIFTVCVQSDNDEYALCSERDETWGFEFSMKHLAEVDAARRILSTCKPAKLVQYDPREVEDE